MDRTFEFDNSQNNNGPISTVDMENIQNNNAMDFIPNRNEINITIEPSPHSINRNLMAMNRDVASNDNDSMAMMGATTSDSHMVEQSMPTTASTSIATFGNLASCSSISSFEPYHQLNELNAYQSGGILLNFTGTLPATTSESLNNYIDFDDDDDDEENYDDGENDEDVESFPIIRKPKDDCIELANHMRDKDISAANFTLAEDNEICHRINVPNAAHEPIRHHKIDIELDTMDDDTISVEEALRALDFAISGGESILSDYPDDSSSDNDDNDVDKTDDDNHKDEKNSNSIHHDRINENSQNNDTTVAPAVDGENQQQTKVEFDANARMPDNMKCTGLIEIADAKDKLIVVINEADETHDEPKSSFSGDILNTEHNREYVYELATELVDSVLEECTAKITQMTNRISVTMNESAIDEPTKNESHARVTADNLIAESIVPMQLVEATNVAVTVPVIAVSNVVAASAAAAVEAATTSNATFNAINLDDSLDETFIIGKLEASTPCHKVDVNVQREPNRMGVNLFQTLDEVNESALSASDIEPLAKADSQFETHIAYATFEVPHENQLAATTFVKNDDVTFNAATASPVGSMEKPVNRSTIENMHDTFDVAAATISSDMKPRNDVPRMNPSIKIDKEEANSDDLTTQTPMNTPIELNYLGDSWDQFVSKSMNTKSNDCIATPKNVNIDTAAIDDDSQQMTNQTTATSTAAAAASISNNPWFLHRPQSNDTFDVNDTDYSNYDGINDDSESIDDNPELLSLTFDALRKQLAESLPHASGNLL